MTLDITKSRLHILFLKTKLCHLHSIVHKTTNILMQLTPVTMQRKTYLNRLQTSESACLN